MDSTSDAEFRICDVWIWNGNYGIPPVKGSTTQRDWAVTQKAWWDAILAIDSDRKTVRVALELRITGGSNIILAPQRRNDLGTYSIDTCNARGRLAFVLSIVGQSVDILQGFHRKDFALV